MKSKTTEFSNEIVLEKAKKKILQNKTARLIFIVCIFLVACAVFYFVSKIVIGSQKEKPSVLSVRMESGTQCGYFKDQLVCLNRNGILFIDSFGSEQYSYSKELSTPLLSIGKSEVLAYEAGGRRLFVTDGNKVKFETTLDDMILSAKISSGGNLITVTRESGYKATVTVYNKSFSPIYRWHSSEEYVADADVNEKGNILAVATYSGKDAMIASSVQFFFLNRTEPLSAVGGMNGFGYSLDFKENDVLHYITSDGLYCITGFANFDMMYPFDTAHLVSFSTKGNGTLIAVNKNVSGEESQLMLFTENSMSQFLNVSGTLKALALSEHYFAVLNDSQVFVYNSQGKLQKQAQANTEAKDMMLSDDGDAILLEPNQIIFVK